MFIIYYKYCFYLTIEVVKKTSFRDSLPFYEMQCKKKVFLSINIESFSIKIEIKNRIFGI